MHRRKRMTGFEMGRLTTELAALLGFGVAIFASGPAMAQEGWKTGAPREEIKPEFSFDSHGGPDGTGAFTIRSDSREGLHGFWMRSIPVIGGKYYRFSAIRRTENVSVPRRSAVA